MTAIGHFGLSNSFGAPPGDFLIVAGGHYWFRHLIEGHVELGFGLSNGTFLMGVGTKLNLIELIDDPNHLVSSVSTHRGVAAPVLRDLMLYFSLDLRRLSFRAPVDPYYYTATTTSIQPGMGVQWYIKSPVRWALKWYLDTSLSYGSLSGSKVLLPHLGLGVELR